MHMTCLQVLVPSYLADPVMGDVVRQFPLYVVTDELVGVLGARVRAERLLRSA